MLNNIKDAVATIKEKEKFIKYKEENPESYLTSAFSMVEYERMDDAFWQLDFYSPKTKKITSFVLHEKIEVKEEQDIFQKEKNDLMALDLKSIKINFREAIDTINEFIDNKYSGESPSKIIVILQATDNKPVWNITYLTKSFNILNIKLNAEDGTIIADKLESVLKFKAPMSKP